MEKTFVDVRCDTFPDGSMEPRMLIWPDGRSWTIVRTLHISEPTENEFEGIRYTVLIGSAERNIYRVGSSWYVEPTNVEVDSS